MSMKFSNWLSKKDKKSAKPAGCITGIFQLFDRHHLLSCRQQQKKNPSGHALLSLDAHEADYSKFCDLEESLSRSYQETCRSSMESSSRTSFSSAFKFFSSLEHKSRQDELRWSEQSVLSGKPPMNTSRSRSSDIKQSPDLRDIIKESDIKINKVLKPIDSPRPIVGLSKLKDLEESLRILIKLKELPSDFHEIGGSPRYSYDGREILQAPKDFKYAIKQKVHRRLSLDSTDDSRRCDFNSKFNLLVKELKRNTNHRVSEASDLVQDLETNENYPNIVAKLMGLEPVNPAKKNNIKGYDKESKQGKSSQSPTNSPKSQRSINQHRKSTSISKFVDDETQQKMTVGSIEGSTKQNSESIYSVKEKALQKLQFQHNSKEIGRKLSGDWNFKSAKSLSPQFIQPASKSGKATVRERASKTPTVVLKPASKSAGTSSCQFVKLEGPSGLGKIRTSDLSSRKKESSIVDGEQTPTGNNSVSPRLQKRKPDQEKKSGTVIPSYELKKTERKPGNRQQSEPVSPRGRIKQRPIKAQDNEGNLHLFQQSKGKTDSKTSSESNHKQYQMIPREVHYVKELGMVAPPLSSPNSVLNASLYPDDSSLSPLSVSSISNEDVNLPSDLNLKMMHLPLRSNSCFGADYQKSETMDITAHKSIVIGTTTDETPVTNEVTLTLDNQDPDNKYVAELLLGSGLLTKDPHTPAMLEEINPVVPSATADKNSAQMLHKQLVFDVVNEILAGKKEAFNYGLLEPARLTAQLLFKELCAEIKCLQSSGEGIWHDKESVFTADLLRPSKAWDRFESEVPVIVVEIERLIFSDLINEIVSSKSAALECKERHRRQLFS